jgi:hypothetical protein
VFSSSYSLIDLPLNLHVGAISTVVASYLAKARGSNEPDLSKHHSKELDQFLRDIKAFILDHGDDKGREWESKIAEFRDRLEEIEAGAKR